MNGRTKVRRGAMVVVDWLDATAHGVGWDRVTRGDNRAEPARSMGIVLACSSDAITLAGDWSPSEKHKGDVNRAFTIPLGMVTAVREVRLSDCRRLR